MTAPKLNDAAKASLDQYLASVADSGNYAAQFMGVTTADGPLYYACKGERVWGEPDKGQVDENTSESPADVAESLLTWPALELWSMTKLMVGIACLQLHEKGLINYDDPEFINKHLPELAKQMILEGYGDDGKPILKDRKNPLTLRHLLTHTSGVSYGVMDPDLGRWEKENGIQPWMIPGATVASITSPLRFEPGTHFRYGMGIDWAGVLVERISGKSLEEYMKENIWTPCGMTSVSFYPNDELKSRLMQMCTRDKDGKIIQGDGMRPVPKLSPKDITFLSGGGGTLGTLKDYMTMLQHILACKDKDGGILSSASYRLLMAPALPRESEGVHKDLGFFMQMLGETAPEVTSGEAVNHSLGLCLVETDLEGRRKAGSGFWGGAAKTNFWMDPTAGIAAVMGTNVLDEDRSDYREKINEFERIVYKGLADSK